MDILACDVSKKRLDIFDGKTHFQVENTPAAIRRLLNKHPKHKVICEATSFYHLALANTAYGQAHEVFVVNPKEARNFKDSLSFRAKTDALDAEYLHEFLLRHRDRLRTYKPASPELARLRELMGQRQVVVESRTAMAQAFGRSATDQQTLLLQQMTEYVVDLERQMESIASQFAGYALLRSIPGVGPISGCALLFMLESRHFESADALVAFCGLDVRVRESGAFKGQGKLTKRGDPLFRCLVCAAGRSLLLSKCGRRKKLELIARNRRFAEQLAIAGRKILRTAFGLLRGNVPFDIQKWSWGVASKT